MNNCNGLAGLIFGHKFKVIFNETFKPGKVSIKGCIDADEMEAVIRANTEHTATYVKTECARCGANPATNGVKGGK